MLIQQALISIQPSAGGTPPSAPVSLQVINQGGPNNGPTSGTYNFGPCFGSSAFTYTPSNSNYQGISWRAATPGSNPIAKYNIYRNGTLYDSVTTPITITGYISGFTFTVTGVSGGSSTDGITDGKILSGQLLNSAASGFNANTFLSTYSASTGAGGTGSYQCSQSQTVGSSGSPATFTTWSYNDTASTNCNIAARAGASTIYAYTVSAVDTLGNEGPQAKATMYLFNGYTAMQSVGLYDYGGASSSGTDTAGSPVNGPYDISMTWPSGDGGFNWPMGAGNGNNLCPGASLELGAFINGAFEFDMKITDSSYQLSTLSMHCVTGAYGVIAGSTLASASQNTGTGVFTTATQAFTAGEVVELSGSVPSGFAVNTPYYVLSTNLSTTTCMLSATSGGTPIVPSTSVATTINYSFACSIDASHIQQVNIFTYAQSPIVVGQWIHYKIPMSVLAYGVVQAQASFTGTAPLTGNLVVSSITSKTCFGIDGSSEVIGTGIPANTFVVGPSNMNSGGTGTYIVSGPNIVGTESVGTQAVTLQNTRKYKFGFQWDNSIGGASPTYYFNNMQYTP